MSRAETADSQIARLLLEEFETYRARSQSQSLSGYDETRASAALSYIRAALNGDDVSLPDILTNPRPEAIKDSDRINRRTR